MSTEIADAYVALYVTMPGVKRDVEKYLGAATGAGKAPGEAIGDSMLKGAGNVIKGGALALGGLVAAGLGTALVKGFERLDALDKAEAKLSGLGHSAQSVDEIMNNALASVKGTAFGMGDAATVAATVVAAGVEPGEDLERTLKLVGDAATIAGSDMASMGSIVSKVATSDMMQMDVANQLMDAGIPILQLLADEMGITADEARKMASAGEISFADFQAALESGLGGAALESGSTFQGAMDNALAALGRLGEKLLGGMFEDMKGEFGGITEYLDDLGPAFEDIGSSIGSFASDAIPVVIDGLKIFFDTLIAIVGWVNSNSGWLTPLAIGIATIVGAITAWIAVSRTYSIIMGIVAAAQTAYTAATYGAAGASYAGAAATNAQRIAMIAGAAAQKIATAAQWAWNAAMSANPIMLVVLAIAALVAALVWFFTQTELGQEIWAGFMSFLGDAWNWLWSSVIEPVINWIVDAWNFLVEAFMWQYENIMKPVFDAIAAVFDWIYNWIIKPIIFGIILYITIWATIFTWLYENIVKPVFEGIAAVFTWLYENVILPVIDGIAAVFTWIYESIIKPVWEGIVAAIHFGADAMLWLYENVVVPVFEAIGAVFDWIYNWVITPIVQGVILYIEMWAAIFTWLYENVVTPIFNGIGAIFTWLYESVVKPVWSGIQAAISVVADWITNTLWPGIQSVLTWIGDGFENMKSAVVKVWEAIKQAAIEPVNFVINSVYNDGIRDMFNQIAEAVGLGEDIRLPYAEPIKLASGGVLPGWSPGRDIHQFWSPTGGALHLSGGEAIMRPEFTAWFGRSGIAALNAAARTGRLGELLGGQAFADGGIWETIGQGFGAAGDWLSSVVGSVAAIIADPLGSIDRLLLEPVQAMLESIGGGTFGQMMAEIPLRIVDGVKDWFSGLLAPTTQGVNGNWTGGSALALVQQMLTNFPGLFITDTYRDPAYNAAVGGSPTSYHMDPQNPAVDIAGPWDQMNAFAAMAYAMPAGTWRQILWQVAGHFDHVHVAADGSVWDAPKKYDNGGWLAPGRSEVVNLTGKPEAVLTAEQWEAVKAGRGVTINQTNYMPVTDPNVVGDRLAAAASRGLVGVSA